MKNIENFAKDNIVTKDRHEDTYMNAYEEIP